MILEQQKQSQVLTDGQQSQESIGMSLDLDSAQVLMQMLSKNLYSDAIGSTIRECASNALDSHRRAGVNEPIIVSLGVNSNNTYEFSVEDFGIGLDDEDVKNIISKYGKSTKRDSATELGMMGLGFKAPLAYTSSFYFICRKNGIERKYMMYEGEDVNTIDLLHEAPTKERNGVKVIVPIASYDRYTFETKISEQLAYFENVYFNCKDIDNSFQIVRHEHFQWSPLCRDNELHLCLDNVYYPIDFQKLGIGTLIFPVALKFGLSDGIFPTPNRESIRYTQEAKDVILKKISKIADYFVEKYNESIQDSDDPLAVLLYYKSNVKTVNVLTKNLNIGCLLPFATVTLAKPSMPMFPLLNMEKLADKEHYLFSEYEVVAEVANGRCHTSRFHGTVTLNTLRNANNNDWYSKFQVMLDGNLGGKLKDFLRERGKSFFNTKHNIVLIKRKKNTIKLGLKNKSDYFTYYRILELDKVPKSQWRAVIQEFQKMLDVIDASILHIDNSIVPQEWVDSRKKVKFQSKNTPSRRVPKLQGEVIGKVAVPLERYNYEKHCKFIPVTIQMENAHREKKFTIYAHHDKANKMDMLYGLLSKRDVRILTFSEREIKTLSKIKLHNWISMEDFMKGEHIVFRRAVTAGLIKNLKEKYRATFTRTEFLGKVSSDLSHKLDALNRYSTQYHYIDNPLFMDMLDIAEKNNMFDYSIYETYKEIKEILETYSFIETLAGRLSYSENSSFVDIFVDLFKYHKKRVNTSHYKLIKLNVENPTPVDIEVLEEAI